MDFFEIIDHRLRGNKVVLLGVGNSLRGDDGVGPALAAWLEGKIRARVIDTGEVPENYLGPIIAEHPDVLVILDAADSGSQPGSMGIIELNEIANANLSTHSSSLKLFIQVLKSEIDPDVFVLGVQPGSTEFGAPLSEPVLAAARVLEQALLKILRL